MSSNGSLAMSRGRNLQVVPTWESLIGTVTHGDCVAGMSQVPDGVVDLAFSDPPFNINEDYDEYDDNRRPDEYLAWSRTWLEEVYRVLKKDGTFWLAIGPKFVSELDVLAKQIGFRWRKHVVWYFTFGVNEAKNFTTSKTHLLYYTKHRARYTFHDEAVRVPSARQVVYNDPRARPEGRLPDDTWILRPQDVVGGFDPADDVQYHSRIAGTFKQRQGTPNQMPEQLLGRIIRACSSPGELVLDPFSGSGTTAAVAKKLGRRFLTFDLSPAYVAQGTLRIQSVKEGDMLDGPGAAAEAAQRARSKRNLAT